MGWDGMGWDFKWVAKDSDKALPFLPISKGTISCIKSTRVSLSTHSSRSSNSVSKDFTSFSNLFTLLSKILANYPYPTWDVKLSRWFRYFSLQLSKGHNRLPRSGHTQKQNQDSANKIGPNTITNKNKKSKPSRKKMNSSTLKSQELKKDLVGSKTGKLTLLTEIRSLLKKLEN
ncbi:hypothetical protein RhiirC2_797867 [Rhizophagus irregularis]|uniref:Uncharacterized protein n=1 Tax=Rhizophagus irregularis TaxID=588596 RepID=A0A2N1M7A7_9GLOM|nr:hypothetical protein RhiirC2_797867 [Rhizophagus irregularis]